VTFEIGYKKPMAVKNTLEISVETKADGSKLLDLFGRTQITLTPQDAECLARLLTQSTKRQSAHSLAVVLCDHFCAKAHKNAKPPPVRLSGIPKSNR
jgi:hypothetical protein